MADQQMKTDFIIETQKALDNIAAVQKALQAIDDIKFTKLTNAFNEIGKDLNSQIKTVGKQAEQMQKVAGKVSTTAIGQGGIVNPKEIEQNKTLLTEFGHQIKTMREQWYQNRNIGDTSYWDSQRVKLANIVTEIGRMDEKMYGAGKAAMSMINAFKMLDGIKNLPGIDNLRNSLMNDIARLSKDSAEMKQLVKEIKQYGKQQSTGFINQAYQKAAEYDMKNPLEKLRIQRQNMQRAISANIVNGVDITRDKRWDLATDKFIRLAEIAAKAQDAVGNTKNAVTLLNQALKTNEAQAQLQGINKLIDKYNNKLKTTNQVSNQTKIVKPDYKSHSDELKHLISDQRSRMENIKIDTPQWQREANKLGIYIRELGRLTLAAKGPNEALKFLKRNFDNIYAMGNTTAKANTISFLQNIATKAKVSKEELNKLLSVQERIAKAQANIPKTSEQKLTAQITNMRAAYDKNNAIANTSKWNVAVQQLIQMASNADKTSGSLRVLEDVWRRFGETLGQKFGLDKALQEFNQGKAKIDAQLKQIRDEAKAQTPQAQQKKAEAQSLANAKAQVQAKKEERQQRELNAKLQAAEAKLSARQQQQLRSFQREYNKFRNDIANHTGEGQAFYTQKQFTAAENRMNRLIEKAERLKDVLGHKFTNRLPNQLQTLLDGTNKRNNVDTRWVETLQQRISRLNEETARFYGQWQKTGKITDLLRFRGALYDLRQAQREADKLGTRIKQAFNIKDIPKNIWNFLENRAKWAMSGMFSNVLWEVPSEVMSSYVELERAMAGVQQVMPLIEGKQREVNAEFERLNSIAAEFGQNSKDVVEAAQLWGRGYGKGDVTPLDDELTKQQKQMAAMQTTNELVRQSAILATVDNFGMAESVRGLEAVLAAYGMRAKSAAEATLFAGRAVDIITKVSHTGQISAQELVAGLQATGKAAEQAGVSLAFLTGLIETGVRNTGMSGSNIGNALKSMMVGLQSDKAAEEMKKFGVEVTKVAENGKTVMRPMEEVIMDVAAALKTGDVNAKNMLLRISGGKMQFSKISAILRDGAEIMRMWGEASNSAGFAQQQLEVQMNTFAVKLQRIRADLTQIAQDLVASGVGNTLKSLIDTIDGMLKAVHEGSTGFRVFATMILGGMLIPVAGRVITAFRTLKQAQIEYNAIQAVSNGVVQKQSLLTAVLSNLLGFKTQAQIKSTTAIEADTVAQTANNISKMQGVALTTAMTGGLNLLLGALMAVTAGYTLFGGELTDTNDELEHAHKSLESAQEKIQKATVNLSKEQARQVKQGKRLVVSNNELAEGYREYREALNDVGDAFNEKSEILEQQIQQEQDVANWIEQGGKMYLKYKEAVDDANTSDEKRAELQKDMEFMMTKFMGVLDEEEAKMLQNAQSNEEFDETFKKLAESHREKAKSQKADLLALLTQQQEYYRAQINYADSEASIYQASLDNFYEWSFGQIEGLSLVEDAWASFWKFWAGMQRWMAQQEQKIADKRTEEANKLAAQIDAGNYSSPEQKEIMEQQLEVLQAQASNWQSLANIDDKDADRAVAKSQDTLKKKLNQARTGKASALNAIADAQQRIMAIDAKLYGTGGLDRGELTDSTKTGGSGGKGRHKKQQIMYSTDVEKAIHNMMADGSFSDDGWTHSLLKALVDYNGGNIADLSKISSKIEEYFRPEANKSDPMEIAYAFQQFALNNSNQKGWEGVIEQLYGAAADMVKAKLKNDAEWIDNNFTWKNSYKGIYGETLNVLDGLKQGMSAWVGKSMDLAEVGCVEAVEKIGSFYSEFLKEQFDANVRYIPTLLENAKKQGIDVVAFDESKLEVGDLVTWANPGDYNNHIGIFTGYKNGKAMVADNSSGENKILERELYRPWQAVESIVKTGKGGKGSQIPWVNSKKKDSIYEWDGDRKNRADNKVKEQYKWQEKEYEIAVERAKLEQEFTGDTISYQKAINQLRELHIKQMSNYIDETQEAYDKGLASLNAYINNSKTIQAALKRANVTSFNDLSEAEQKDLLNMNAKNGDDRAKNAVKIYEMLKQIKEELPKARLNLQQEKNALRADNGYMKPEDRYKWQKQLVNDWDATSHDNRLLQADRNLELDLIELQRLEVELAKAKKAEEDEINKKLAKRLVLETEIAKLNQKETLTDKDKEKLKELNAAYKELGEDIDNLRTNHSKTYRDITQQYNQHTKATRESAEEVRKIANEYKKAGADITVDFFDKLINEGASLGDAIEDLRKEIAKIAIKWFTYKAFNLPINKETFGDSPLEQILIHSQDKGEQDLTPTGLNTTATQDNTKALERLSTIISHNPQVLTANPSMGGLINNPAIYNYGMQGQNPAISQMTSTLQSLLSNIPMLGNPLAKLAGNIPQMVMQNLRDIQMKQLSLTTEQQGNIIKQQGNIQEQANTSAMYALQASLERNTMSNNMSSQGGAGGLGGGVSGEAGGETSGFGGLFGSLFNIFGLFTGSINQNTAQLTENTAGLDKTGNILGKIGGTGGGGFAGIFGGGLLGFLPLILALLFGDKKGGSLKGFKKGGKPTNGLIKGAGTGTSDSILTYLQHKGRFIKTSDGEFIVNAKATDKLGVDTLNAINQHPELFTEMLLSKKGLATGGSVDYVPTMKSSTPKTYKSYTQTKASMSNPNGKMEELMSEQNGLISGLSNQSGSGQIVVLNTQADSQAIMKAIHDNPRAFRQLLGQQRNKGFR